MANGLTRRTFLGAAAGATAGTAMAADSAVADDSTPLKIVAICGSPRPGKTTATALKVCLDAAGEVDNRIQTELIELAGMKIDGSVAAGIPLAEGERDDFPELADFNAYIMTEHLKGRADHFVVVPHNQAIFPYRISDWPPEYTHPDACHRDHPHLLGWAGFSTTGASYGYCYTPFERPARPTTWNMLTGAVEDSSLMHPG